MPRGATSLKAGRHASAPRGRKRASRPGYQIRAVEAADKRDVDGVIEALRQAIAQHPGNAELYLHLGNMCHRQHRIREAFEAFHKAVTLDPQLAAGYNSLSLTLRQMGQAEASLAASRLAIKIEPTEPSFHCNLATTLYALNDQDAAAAAFRQALQLAPRYLEALVMLTTIQRDICDWNDLDEAHRKVVESTYRIGKRVSPFSILATTSSAEEHLACARTWARHIAVPAADVHVHAAPVSRGGPLRVGYLSADFHNHATALLMAELIERHDRARFTVVGLSLSQDDGSAIRQRLIEGFDAFVDLRGLSHRDAAARINAERIDILIDLKGYTRGAQPEILAYRPAPIQVNYLGYPGSMGADFVDYIVADPFIIPTGAEPFYDEAVVRLPHCYQPNDTKRAVSTEPLTRAVLGLPETGFVFCCFNNTYKITPAVFAIWTRLLRATPNAVLWLFEANPLVAANLRLRLTTEGLDPARLIFAPKVDPDRHIARMRLADLFLDTLPINAHTTASEALWAGLPVLTCAGEAFAGRVAGSLLHAAGLPELVTDSLERYEQRALELARDTRQLAALRDRLHANRLTSPLFDIARYTRDFEAALERMAEIRTQGRRPEAISIPPTL